MVMPRYPRRGELAPQIPVEIREVLPGPALDGEAGESLLFRTNLGDIQAILHSAKDSSQGIVWVCGARGGFVGPGPGSYARLAEAFQGQGITSLRMDYRQPGDLEECVADLLAGVTYLQSAGYEPVVLVGHSFGGAVVIAAGVASSHVRGVVSLSPQTYGAGSVTQLSPKHLLVVHGKSDTRLPYYCAQQIHDSALEPKRLVLYEGVEHRLEECRAELEELLSDWIPDVLNQPELQEHVAEE